MGAELTASGSSAAIHPEVQKVTREREMCRLMDAATESVAEAPPVGPHSSGPLSIAAILTLASAGHQNRRY